jgi:hypothetical protein
MVTVRQLERLWLARQYDRMLRLFIETRPEASVRLVSHLARSIPTAAMAVVRLDELNQSHTPFCARMLRAVLAGQEADGGWGDPLNTAICLRALLCSDGDGPAIDRALTYLANLQKSDGLWPRGPLRRLPADPFVSAFILFHLADDHRFASAVRLDDTLRWFRTHHNKLDLETARLWRMIAIRRSAVPLTSNSSHIWS